MPLGRRWPRLAPEHATTWDLDGGGALDFVGQDAALQALDAKLAAQSATVDMVGAPGGAVVSCQEAQGVPHNPAAQDLCRVALAGARFGQQPGLELPAKVRLRVSASARQTYHPAQPIRFGSLVGGNGFAVFKQKPDGTCNVFTLDLADEDRAAMCAAWLAAGKPGRELVPGLGDFEIAVAPDFAAPAGYRRDIGADMPRNDGPVTSALGDPAADLQLGNEMGNARISLQSGDYPARALRANIGAKVRVWIGFSRDGKPGSCRPVESSNGSYLANTTCMAMMRGARFDFAPGTPAFQGLRYLAKTVSWAIPVD
ncbi:energy transducer TonB [Novosphingobium olei]|uniref:energy transducer TonB n=1 Tax=Novosphingobium olei TaxID=2728851 RepID=UPI0030891053|nr:hypothetical protein NSDW_09980 [Novosphingobium olei]